MSSVPRGRGSHRFFAPLGAGLLALSACSLQAAEEAKAKPNVLFIAVDDLNDWIGALGGYPGVKTPNLDRLASQGELFTKAYCPGPVCGPSRAALLSGMRSSTTGVYRNDNPLRLSPVLAEAIMLPEYFKNHGYQALGSGKIFHNADPKSWTEFWPSLTRQYPENPKLASMAPGGAGPFNWGPLDVDPEKMADWQTTDWVIERLKNPPQEPMFLACGIGKPHLPWAVPRKYFDLYPLDSITLPEVKEDDLADVPEAGQKMGVSSDHPRILENKAWKSVVQAYLASITFADDCIGRVLDALDDSPLAKNTIVVLWSDHGWHLGEKLRWRKSTLWEEAGRCVLIIRAPGTTKAGTVCDAPVNLIDLYPTLIELCGLPPKEDLEGVSLVPLLRDPAAAWSRPSLTTYKRGNHAVRSERWRYIRYADGSEELYDHQNDPREWTNLAGDPKFSAIKAELAPWMPTTNAPESATSDTKDGD